MHNEGGHTVVTAAEARAGFLGKPILGVLIISTALTVGIFVLTYALVFAR